MTGDRGSKKHKEDPQKQFYAEITLGKQEKEKGPKQHKQYPQGSAFCKGMGAVINVRQPQEPDGPKETNDRPYENDNGDAQFNQTAAAQ